MKATAPRPATDSSAQCRIVSLILPASMITTLPRASPMMSATPSKPSAPSRQAVEEMCSRVLEAEPQPDEERNAEHASRAIEEGVDELLFALPADHADDDRRGEEQPGHLAHPPVRSQNTPDHHHEGHREDGENDLVQAGELGGGV